MCAVLMCAVPVSAVPKSAVPMSIFFKQASSASTVASAVVPVASFEQYSYCNDQA